MNLENLILALPNITHEQRTALKSLQRDENKNHKRVDNDWSLISEYAALQGYLSNPYCRGMLRHICIFPTLTVVYTPTILSRP